MILLVAALLKGYQLAAGPLLGDGLLASRPVLIALVQFEWVFGLFMLFGLYPKRTWQVALVCFSVFACVSLYKGLAGDASCNCFGRLEVSPWYTFALDVGAVLALLLWPPCDRAPGGEPDPADPKRLLGFSRVGVVLAVAFLVGIPGALAMATYRPATLMADGTIVGRGGVVVLEPETWVGKRFPLIEHIDIGGQLAYGDWLVVLYRHDCPGCQELLSEFGKDGAAWGMDPLRTRVALIELPPYGSGSVDPFLSGFTLGRLAGPWKWAVATPTEITLANGRVVNAGTSVQTIGRLERLPRDRLGQRFALDHRPRSCDRCYNHRSERNPKRERGACLRHSLAYASGYDRIIAVSESRMTAICAAS